MVRSKLPPITFTNQDFVGVDLEQNDHMVITVEVANFTIRKLQIPESEIKTCHEQLIGFSSEKVDTRGYVDLLTMRSTLNALGAIVSTPYLVMKFPSSTHQIMTI
ncbi:hypothetical protein CR513_21044, partial [Mucuna pruriens]